MLKYFFQVASSRTIVLVQSAEFKLLLYAFIGTMFGALPEIGNLSSEYGQRDAWYCKLHLMLQNCPDAEL